MAKGSGDIIVALAVAGAAVYAISKVGSSVGSAVESTGQGLRDTLSGVGAGFEYSGMGIYELGAGTGYGIGSLGAGVGSGVASVGAGVQAVGEGTGYAISGANPQDILQTLLTLGKGEASTYNTGVSGYNPDASLRTQSEPEPMPETPSILPTAQKVLGLATYNPFNILTDWIVSKTSTKTLTPSETRGSLATTQTSSSSSLKSSKTSSSSSGGSSILSSATSGRNEFLESLGYQGMTTKTGVVYTAPTSTASSSLKTTKWYNPLTWF